MKPIPVHVISGFLGAGKTTLLMQELVRRQDRERCAIVVNDFGEAQLDASILADHAPIRAIPGGCICCTAPEGLVPALLELIAQENPDRIFIETTGLARPADVVDTLMRSGIEAIELQATAVVVDPECFVREPSPLFRQQLAAADVLVANRADCSSEAALNALKDWAAKRYPPLDSMHVVERGVLPDGALERPRVAAFRLVQPVELPSTDGWHAESRVWGPERIFEMGQLKSIAAEGLVERLKGIFRTDIGWYSIQRAGGRLEVVPTGIRSGSRVDGISEDKKKLVEAISRMDAAVAKAVDPTAVDSVRLEGPEGSSRPVNRSDLMALPRQITDVSTLVPGRKGEAVWLADVLALVSAKSKLPFVLVAGDGMTSAPVAIGEAGEALLVHSLNGEPYPRDKGGPFRVFVPPGEGRSACSNVKQVVRIAVGD